MDIYNKLIQRFLQELRLFSEDSKAHDAFLATLGGVCMADIAQLHLSHAPDDNHRTSIRVWSRFTEEETKKTIQRWVCQRRAYSETLKNGHVRSVAGFWRFVITEDADKQGESDGDSGAIAKGSKQGGILAGIPEREYERLTDCSSLRMEAQTVFLSQLQNSSQDTSDPSSTNGSSGIYQFSPESVACDSDSSNLDFTKVQSKAIGPNGSTSENILNELNNALTFLCGVRQQPVSFISIPLFASFVPKHGTQQEIVSVEIVWCSKPIPKEMIENFAHIHHFVSFVVPYFEVPHLVKGLLLNAYAVPPDEKLDLAITNLAQVLRSVLFNATMHEWYDLLDTTKDNKNMPQDLSNEQLVLWRVFRESKILKALAQLSAAAGDTLGCPDFEPLAFLTFNAEEMAQVLKIISRIWDESREVSPIPLAWLQPYLNSNGQSISNKYLVLRKDEFLQPSQFIKAFQWLSKAPGISKPKLEEHHLTNGQASASCLGQPVSSPTNVVMSFDISSADGGDFEGFRKLIIRACEHKAPRASGQSTAPFFFLAKAADVASWTGSSEKLRVTFTFKIKQEPSGGD